MDANIQHLIIGGGVGLIGAAILAVVLFIRKLRNQD
jgi:hypothetical protein